MTTENKFSTLAICATALLATFGNVFADDSAPAAETEMTREIWEKMSPDERAAFTFRREYRDYILANVDGEIVLMGDIREMTQRYELLLRREAKSPEEYAQKRDQLRYDTLNNLTEQYLLVGEFRDLISGRPGIPEEYLEGQINDRIDRDFDGDRGKYLSYLRARGTNPAAEKKKLKDMIAANEQNRMIASNMRPEISPLIVYQYYKANEESYREPEMVEHARIVITAGASETDEMVALAAKNLTERLKKNPEEFSDSAKVYSRDDWRSAGGYVGWQAMEDLSAPLVSAIKSVKNGEVADLVELPNPATGGKIFVILKRINHRPAGVKPLSELRPQIENILRNSLLQRARSEKIDALKQHYYVYWH